MVGSNNGIQYNIFGTNEVFSIVVVVPVVGWMQILTSTSSGRFIRFIMPILDELLLLLAQTMHSLLDNEQ